MEVKATLKTYRQSPRKVRILAKELSGKSVDEAKAMLNTTPKRVAPVLLKLINSAEANAKDKNLVSEKFKIQRLNVDKGATLFRMRPRAFGRAFVIRKRTSHITVVLTPEEKETVLKHDQGSKEKINKEVKSSKKSVKNS